MKFVQFYFGLPLAMIVLAVTVVPFFTRARVYTAYEYLEQRFDLKTRTLTAFLFLISRGLSCSVVVAAPSLILSIVLGWNLTLTVLLIGVPTVIYTIVGGVQAVTWTDVKQMVIIILGILSAVVILILGLPDGMSLGQALHVAGAVGKTQALDFRFDLTERYTLWSGLIGGMFLSMAYFGCDQSQVQRYLTAKSVKEGRQSLFMSAYFKIPLQALIPADRRADVRVLPVQQGSDAVQSRAPRERPDRSSRRRVSGAGRGIWTGVRNAQVSGAGSCGRRR
jgi:Na+/proline symporter